VRTVSQRGRISTRSEMVAREIMNTPAIFTA
jgi:hypothetical protein